MRNNIKVLREARDWSQDELAKRAGTSKPQIARLEKGDRQLTQRWMERLSKALNCTPGDLIAPVEGGWAGQQENDDLKLFLSITEIIIDQARARPNLKKQLLVGIARAIFKSVKDGETDIGRKGQLNRAVETLIAYEATRAN